MKHELWLEFGYKQDDGWQDMLWYNEGRWQELPYWIKGLVRRLVRGYKTKMYFTIRYGKKGKTVII